MGKKRGNNTGSVFKRDRDGQWVGKVTVGYRDGKQLRKEFTGKTQGEVLQRMSDAKNTAMADLSTSKDIRNLRVSQYLDYWITDIVAKDKFVLSPRRARTKHDYKDICRLHLKPKLGHIRNRDRDLRSRVCRRLVTQRFQRCLWDCPQPDHGRALRRQ